MGLVTFNRPHALNALNGILLKELLEALARFADDDDVRAVVLTGSEKAFAAGADIKEMKDYSYMDAYLGDHTAEWDKVAAFRKPLIAAVSGFALGGGCEVALMCDFIIASETAKFGQPEITLGIIPGMGGTQRLARAVGKAKAMDMVLTGRMIEAAVTCSTRARSPWEISTRPFPASACMASRIAGRPTPKRSISSRSDGISSPALSSPDSIRCFNRENTSSESFLRTIGSLGMLMDHLAMVCGDYA